MSRRWLDWVIAAGVAALARATDAILVCPADLPLLTLADVFGVPHPQCDDVSLAG